jgi:Glycosyltransferase family 87
MGKAVEHDMSPYLPLSDLAKTWLPLWNPYPYPSPYPPLVAVLSQGFAAVGYDNTVRINFWLEALSFGTLVLLLLRWWGGPWYREEKLLVMAVLGTCSAFTEDIRCGQVMAMLAVLLVLAWLALRRGRDVAGGLLLGLFIAVKLIAWPLVFFLLWQRRWRAVGTAAGVVLLANVIGLAVLGWPTVLDYYARVGGSVAELWRGYEANLSAWAWGDRVFRGVGWGYRLEPAFAAPALAAVATWVFPLGLFSVGLWLAVRARAFDTAFGILCAVSILVSPVTWSFYSLLAAVPVAVLLKRLANGRVRAETWCLAGVFLSLLMAPQNFSQQIARAFGDPKVVSFAAGLLTQLPNLGLLGITWMLWRSDAAGVSAEQKTAKTDAENARVP